MRREACEEESRQEPWTREERGMREAGATEP